MEENKTLLLSTTDGKGADLRVGGMGRQQAVNPAKIEGKAACNKTKLTSVGMVAWESCENERTEVDCTTDHMRNLQDVERSCRKLERQSLGVNMWTNKTEKWKEKDSRFCAEVKKNREKMYLDRFNACKNISF